MNPNPSVKPTFTPLRYWGGKTLKTPVGGGARPTLDHLIGLPLAPVVTIGIPKSIALPDIEAEKVVKRVSIVSFDKLKPRLDDDVNNTRPLDITRFCALLPLPMSTAVRTKRGRTVKTIERLFSGNALRPELDDSKWPQLTFFPRLIATVTNGSITDLEDKFEHEILPTFDWLLRAKKFANNRQVKNMVTKRTRCTKDEMEALADEEKESWDWRWCREETCDPGMPAWSHGRNVLDKEKGPAHVSTMLLVALPPWEWTPERMMRLGEKRELKVVSDEDKAKAKDDDEDNDEDNDNDNDNVHVEDEDEDGEDEDEDDEDEDLDKLRQIALLAQRTDACYFVITSGNIYLFGMFAIRTGRGGAVDYTHIDFMEPVSFATYNPTCAARYPSEDIKNWPALPHTAEQSLSDLPDTNPGYSVAELMLYWLEQAGKLPTLWKPPPHWHTLCEDQSPPADAPDIRPSTIMLHRKIIPAAVLARIDAQLAPQPLPQLAPEIPINPLLLLAAAAQEVQDGDVTIKQEDYEPVLTVVPAAPQHIPEPVAAPAVARATRATTQAKTTASKAAVGAAKRGRKRPLEDEEVKQERRVKAKVAAEEKVAIEPTPKAKKAPARAATKRRGVVKASTVTTTHKSSKKDATVKQSLAAAASVSRTPKAVADAPKVETAPPTALKRKRGDDDDEVVEEARPVKKQAVLEAPAKKPATRAATKQMVPDNGPKLAKEEEVHDVRRSLRIQGKSPELAVAVEGPKPVEERKTRSKRQRDEEHEEMEPEPVKKKSRAMDAASEERKRVNELDAPTTARKATRAQQNDGAKKATTRGSAPRPDAAGSRKAPARR